MRKQLITALAFLLLLSGCGFQLRGANDLPPSLNPLFVQGINLNSTLGRELKVLLKDAQIELSHSRDSASSLLNLSNSRFNRRVLSVDSNGKVAEYELHQSIKFELIEGDKKRVATQSIGVTRAYINTEEQVLGKQQEEAYLREDMQRDLAYRIVRRLQAQLK